MWRLIFTIISFLNYDVVNAFYVLNTSAVTWKDAQAICNVSSVNDIMHTERAYTELPTNFTAWTSSFSRTSDWAYFYDESNQRCALILRNDITQSPIYQFRLCSDHLHVLCMDETDSSLISTQILINSDNHIPANSTETAFDISFKPTSTQMVDVQRSGVKTNTFVVGEVVIVNVVLFGLCIFIVIMIFLRKRLTLQVCQTAKQKFQSSLTVISYAEEYLNETEVSLEKATKSCKVPEFYRLRSSNDARDENRFYALTATHEWSSGWAFFQGCIDINIQKRDKQRLSDYFANSNLSFIAVRDDVFQCAYRCTNLNYFVFYMNLCLCITSIEKYPVTDNTGCVTTCQDDSVFCSSGFGIPLFKYQTDMEIVRPAIYSFSYNCVYKKDGYEFDVNCYSSSYYFRCDGKDNIGHRENWANAVNYCTSLNTTLSNAVGNSSSDVWSRYFRYKNLSLVTDKKRRKCVAVFINTNKRSYMDFITWSHYQHRNCSELLPFICVGDIDMELDIEVRRQILPMIVTKINQTLAHEKALAKDCENKINSAVQSCKSCQSNICQPTVVDEIKHVAENVGHSVGSAIKHIFGKRSVAILKKRCSQSCPICDTIDIHKHSKEQTLVAVCGASTISAQKNDINTINRLRERYDAILHNHLVTRKDAGVVDIPDILPAWTGSSVQVSDWAMVAGCLCKSTVGAMDKPFNELRKLFPHDENPVISIDEFQCAFKCTKITIFFIYKDNGCQCLNNHTTTQMNILDKMRQNCARPLHGPNQCDFLLYKFQSYDERKIQKRITDRYLYQCIKLNQMTENDKAHSQYAATRFREVKVNKKCVALESYTEKYNASTYSFQLRDCNDKLPVLCRGHRKETKNDSNVSTTSFIIPVENANHLNERTPVMGVVNVLLFGLLMIFALLYAMVNRRRNALPHPRKVSHLELNMEEDF
ncbi:unnamed protein product [Mytilus coruscus]|uniref:C-type lectin domain-containing protein n=1 Tax=Mytilus coruscus TaxID=42192 RepID=A0A6J8B6I0_MYTCO|nr:unnamed protein product [Mytilus coruscus]